MDAFYAAPRQPPVRTTINMIERTPVVPEVSVVENSFFAPQPKSFNPFDTSVRPHITKNQFLNPAMNHHKKHVRFQNSYPHSTLNSSITLKENIPEPPSTVPNLNGKTFKQIYMANVPDRHLDLSVFEPEQSEQTLEIDRISYSNTRRCPSPVKEPISYQNRYETDVLKSIENTSREGSKAPEVCNEIAKPSDEPTIKDLFKIIQQQNEQIMLLQRQVNNLKSSLRQSEPEQLAFDGQNHCSSPTKKGLFSIDFQTTSFEVSFRPPHTKFRKQNENFEPKIQEIVECDNSKDNQDLSLRLEESLHVKDSYVSAVPSIQINMDEYHSSEEDDSSGDNIGITFYKDLMDQVNNVLKKIQVQSECQKESIRPTLTAVKQATLQHLKSIGVNLSPIQETNEITSQSDNISDPSQISFAVKQLLMKYLPDDKLTKAVNKPKEVPLKEKKTFKPPGTEFSFATLQYLKKYNLIDNKKLEKKDSPKILDVTALKRQPKLL